jgi:amino acid adenylation domain-containing protein
MSNLSDSDNRIISLANCFEQAYSEDTLFSRYENMINQNSGLSKAIAVVDGATGKEKSYGDLLIDSDLFARYIFSKCVFANKTVVLAANSSLIGILSEKGYNQIVSTLSIMKAGYGYLPLHVEWPVGRLDTVLEHGEVKMLLISEAQYSCCEISDVLANKYELVIIEKVLAELRVNKNLQTTLAALSLPKVCADDLAYVIFTSGSTGTPKGVTISHRGALNTIDAVNSKFSISKEDRILALSELSFDLSVYDIFGILAVCGMIVCPDQSLTKDSGYWVDLVSKYKISVWNTVPQLADLLIDEAEQGGVSIFSLRLFLLSGDCIPVSLPSRIKVCCPQAIVMSLGGATEGSIWSIWHEIEEVPSHWNNIPYGMAMPNQKMYILDSNNKHCPVGTVGEIHIGGLGVALNYWRDKDKTEQSFINHPELNRLYRTGDLGRWHANGYIEFIGRKDKQLKIRGYRVEIGEIEHALMGYDGIKQSVVISSEDSVLGIMHLVGYYVSKKPLEKNVITKYLRTRLPDYMIPRNLIHLKELPLSANGKLDVRALTQWASAGITAPICGEHKKAGGIENYSLQNITPHKY